MARHAGVSLSTVSRIWRRNGLKPHRTRTFRLSKDKHSERKFWDVIGLYLDPPEKAVVLCCDEKTQCQALERTQPGLLLGIGHIRTQTNDCYRHWKICLFAAMSYLEGKLIYRTEQKHPHVEWFRFLKQIHREVPKDLDVPLIADNCSTHKHAKVKSWLKQHQRFHMHFTPTSSSWMNLVERFFADLTEDCIRAGSLASVKQLTDAITSYPAERNENPKPYRWKAYGEKILAKIHLPRKALGGPSQYMCHLRHGILGFTRRSTQVLATALLQEAVSWQPCASGRLQACSWSPPLTLLKARVHALQQPPLHPHPRYCSPSVFALRLTRTRMPICQSPSCDTARGKPGESESCRAPARCQPIDCTLEADYTGFWGQTCPHSREPATVRVQLTNSCTRLFRLAESSTASRRVT